MVTSTGNAMRFSALLLLLLTLPGPLKAQAGQASSAPSRAEATGTILLKGSKVAGADRLFLGGWAGLVFGNRLAIGGGGLALMENVELVGSESSTGFDLGVGYGGLTLRYWLPWSSRVTGELGLLLGAGHAQVRSLVTGTEVGSDNFAVAEPELSLFVTTLPWLHLGASAGYRMAWGVEDLPRVAVDDLRAFTASISLRIGGS